MSRRVDTVVLKEFFLASCVGPQLGEDGGVCVQNALTAVYLGNIASLFIRGATFLKVIESISSGWPGCVDILQYLPVTFAHFDARPSFTHENTTSRSWAQILISKMKGSVAGRATVQHLQGSGNTWGQRNKTQNMTVDSRRTKIMFVFFSFPLPLPLPLQMEQPAGLLRTTPTSSSWPAGLSVDVFAQRCPGLVTTLSAAENAPPEAAIRLLSSSLRPTNGRKPGAVAKSGATEMFGGTFGAVRMSAPVSDQYKV